MVYLLDTSFLIDFLRNQPSAVGFIHAHQSDTMVTCSICIFELYCGAFRIKNPEKREYAMLKVRDLTGSFSEIMPFDSVMG